MQAARKHADHGVCLLHAWQAAGERDSTPNDRGVCAELSAPRCVAEDDCGLGRCRVAIDEHPAKRRMHFQHAEEIRRDGCSIKSHGTITDREIERGSEVVALNRTELSAAVRKHRSSHFADTTSGGVAHTDRHRTRELQRKIGVVAQL
jgi:hypothetical protein